jgi:tetratricopeptide (TPR) repeat protein
MGASRLAALILALTLAGCAAPREAWRGPGEGLPVRVELTEVPFHEGDDGHCGPAAAAMVLHWTGVAIGPAEAAAIVFTPARGGTLQHDLVSAVRREGRLAVAIESRHELLAELAAGHPVLILQNLGLPWYPVWHYAVAVGYDLAAGEIVLRSGEEARRRISLATFDRTWARAGRWGLVVLPPGRLPATGSKLAVMAAAAGIERAGRPAEAALAYDAILDRWPGSLVARIGLANARHALGDAAGAEQALRSAVLLHPEAAPAWNNLAHLLAERGQQAAALAAAERAAALAPDHLAVKATLASLAATPDRH